MGAAFLITLREGLEISLVLAILLGYLVKIGRGDRVGAVWGGTGIAAVVCTVAGVAVHLATKGLHGKAEPAVEGTLALLACLVLTWMILWMHKNSKSMGGHLRAKVDGAENGAAVAAIAFVAVAREGFETALFLLGAETRTASGAQVVVGGVLGLAVSSIVGVLIYRFGKNIDLRTFFRYTGVLLILFAAGLAGKAVHEYGELFGASGWLIDPMWTISSGPLASGSFYDFLNGLFGWVADPERARVVAHLTYLLPVLTLFLRPDRTVVSAAVTEVVVAPQVETTAQH
jgi:high-affinity iron transporter